MSRRFTRRSSRRATRSSESGTAVRRTTSRARTTTKSSPISRTKTRTCFTSFKRRRNASTNCTWLSSRPIRPSRSWITSSRNPRRPRRTRSPRTRSVSRTRTRTTSKSKTSSRKSRCSWRTFRRETRRNPLRLIFSAPRRTKPASARTATSCTPHATKKTSRSST